MNVSGKSWGKNAAGMEGRSKESKLPFSGLLDFHHKKLAKNNVIYSLFNLVQVLTLFSWINIGVK